MEDDAPTPAERYGALWHGQPLPIRIPLAQFTESKSQHAVRQLNRDAFLRCFAYFSADPKRADMDRIAQAWFCARHGMNPRDYSTFRDNAPFLSLRDGANGRAMGGMIFEEQRRAVFASIFFYDPALARRSLGTFLILSLIDHARERGLSYVKLGKWHPHPSYRTAYKTRFQPCELLMNGRWQPCPPGFA